MPVCFQLFRKGPATQAEAVSFQLIDDEMRVHFGCKPDPDHWLNGWYDSIGFRLALGKTFQQIREADQEDLAEARARGDASSVKFNEDELQIVDWLEERFTPNSWYELKH